MSTVHCYVCCCRSVNFVHSNLILVFNCPYCCICSYTDSYHAYYQLFLRYSCGSFSSHCNCMHWSPLMLTPGWEDCSDNVMWVSYLFHCWIVWIPSSTASSFVNHQVKKKKSRSLTIVAPNWLSLSLFSGMRPLLEWKNLFIFSCTVTDLDSSVFHWFLYFWNRPGLTKKG